MEKVRARGLHRWARKSIREVRKWVWTSVNFPRRSQYVRNIVSFHFSFFSEENHPARAGFEAALEILGGRPAAVVETGTSAWGADSTRLWAKYVNVFGGELYSVDLRPEPAAQLGNLGDRCTLVVDDSVNFLNGIGPSLPVDLVQLVYLDSFDVDWFNPKPSAIHGFNEWEAVQRFARAGTVVIVDDTPLNSGAAPWLTEEARASIDEFVLSTGLPPGKGSLVFRDIQESTSWRVIFHQYNLVAVRV